MSLGVDNTAARDLAYNPEHHTKTKHIDRRHFFVREAVENLQITVPYVNTLDNLADFFTKVQKPTTFRAMRDIIMNVPPHLSCDDTENTAPGTTRRGSLVCHTIVVLRDSDTCHVYATLRIRPSLTFYPAKSARSRPSPCSVAPARSNQPQTRRHSTKAQPLTRLPRLSSIALRRESSLLFHSFVVAVAAAVTNRIRNPVGPGLRTLL